MTTLSFHFRKYKKGRSKMVINQNLLLLFAFNLFLSATLINGSTDDYERKPYIVYMGDASEAGISAVEAHHDLLTTAIGDERLARESRVHSYGKSFNGFVARLLPEEAKRLSKEEGVVSVFENTRRKLHTTRTWDFLGMSEKLQQRNGMTESNIIIGLLDTGIWIESPSFNDKGYGPPPARWKGQCVTGPNFTSCNNKVIGARFYTIQNELDPAYDQKSPVDSEGHGTHTSSTAAGSFVEDASFYGLAKGNARGGVPSARIAMYKVCWSEGCNDMDILAAFDDAIADGVDVISVSLGGQPISFFTDAIAIGAFHAMKRGIFTACSAGNSGPFEGTVENVAPWIMTVAASSIDRKFVTPLKLGNGMRASGISINTFSPRRSMYPLTNGARATNATGNTSRNISACDSGTLSEKKVKGKIVYCLGEGLQDYIVKELGGAGAIMALDAPTDTAFTTVIAATTVSSKVGLKIDRYINTTKEPQAIIYRTKVVKAIGPFIASFSSRGPQSIAPDILKPDIAAPGLDVVAAYSRLASVTELPGDNRFAPFNILSGTSMSCPHVAAAATYVKSFHPDWSPAAIKSALMTTATPMKVKDEDGELASGSGEIDPIRAVHPGLIYDIDLSSYAAFLCKEGYNSTSIGQLIGGKTKFSCSNVKPARGRDGLNYPSMHTRIDGPEIAAVFYRTVTQVAPGESTYKLTVHSPEDLSIKVVPNTLTFTRQHEKRSFMVIVKGSMPNGARTLSASLDWSDTKHNVRSPIVIYRPLFMEF